MASNSVRRIAFIILFLSAPLLKPARADENQDKVHETHYYAKKYYREGRYKDTIRAYEKILKILPNHEESLKMISKCRQKIALTEDLIIEAVDRYKEGTLLKALEKLRMAFKKDSQSYKVRYLLTKILTELGMEYSFVGRHSKALDFLNKAHELSPDDQTINGLIKISESLLLTKKEDIETVSAQAVNMEKIEEMFAAFEEYQKKQVKIISEYNEAQSKMQEMLQSSEKEKKRLLALLKNREIQLKEIFENQKKEEKMNIFQNRYFLLSLSMLLVAFIFIAGKYSGKKHKKLSDYEKKIRKLKIIESELAVHNQKESQVALTMLEQFLKDRDYKIKLKVIKLIHKIDPKAAINMLDDIIMNKKGDFRKGAFRLLGELKTLDSIELLLRVTDSDNEKMKEKAIVSLSEILKNGDIDGTFKERIRNKLDKIYVQENWVIE